MIDKELFARATVLVKNNPSTTINQLSIDMDIGYDVAWDMLDQLEEANLVINFGTFYAPIDLN